METEPLISRRRPICEVIQTDMNDSDNGPYTSYGIRYLTGGEPFVVADISTDRALVSQMADLFTRCGVVSKECLLQAIVALIS